MKKFLTLAVLFCLDFTALAQQDSAMTNEKKLYVGLGLNTTGFHIYYKNKKGTGIVRSGYYTPVTLHLNYRLTERARVQAGVSYGGDKDQNMVQNINASGEITTYEALSRTHVIALPVTAQFILLTVKSRFPIYATASVIPAFGSTYSETWEIQNGVELNRVSVKDSGMNTFATGGLGFNYKISRRLGGYAEYLFYKHNLTGSNSFFMIGTMDFQSLDLFINRWH